MFPSPSHQFEFSFDSIVAQDDLSFLIGVQYLCCHLHEGVECLFHGLSFLSCSLPNPGGGIGGSSNGGAEYGFTKVY